MPIADFFSRLNIGRFLGTMIAGFVKRYGENWYDRLPELPFFRKLQEQGPFVTRGIESTLYAIAGVLDQIVGEDTFFKKLFKELGMDFGSEFSKRLINGGHVKEILIRNPGHWETREEKELASILADMEDADLEKFLRWANATTARERRKDAETFKKMTAEQITNRNKNPELFQEFLQYFRGPKKELGVLSEFFNPFRRELIERAIKRRGGSNEK